jgi:4-hydroxythreonine-4-phosphate dehydrogenase
MPTDLSPALLGPPIAVTMGEPAGIGGEILLLAWRRRRAGDPVFFALDDPPGGCARSTRSRVWEPAWR